MLPTPPGWFPDPWNPGLVRYWDGRQWTPSVAGPPAAPTPAPTLPWRVAVGGVLALVVPLVASRWLLRPLAGQSVPAAVFVALAGLLAYGPTLWFWWWSSRRWGSGSMRADAGLVARLADLGWGPVVWIGCFLTQATLVIVVNLLRVPFRSNLEGFDDLRDDTTYLVATFVLAVVVAPFVEEVLFRGLIQRSLASTMPQGVAVAVQAVMFGAAHFDPHRGVGNIGLVLVLSGVGAVLGTAAMLTRRLVPGMIAHALMNGVAMLVAFNT
jgi:membrane protease YdiL (CAAX protease family)